MDWDSWIWKTNSIHLSNIRLVQSRYPIISSVGDLGKSGPGPRSKADALKNARKTGGGSLFGKGFTPHRQYCSRPSNKPLSCWNNVKINENQFNVNQNTKRIMTVL